MRSDERDGEREHDEREQRVQAADPAVCAGEGDLHCPDYGQQRGEQEVAALQPGDQRDDEDQDLEPVSSEAHCPVRVERGLPGAEDVGPDQIDLDEDGEHDRHREREVQPRGAASYAGEQAPP